MPRRRSTREDILTAAGRVFAEHGYEGSTLAKLAGQLDVGKSAILYHFTSKDEILRALMEPVIAAVSAVADRHEAKATPASPEEVMADMLDVAISNPRASLTLVRDPHVWVNPVLGGAMTANMDRLVDILTTREPEAVNRAHAAFSCILRSGTLGLDLVGEPITDPTSRDAAVAIGLAVETMTSRLPEGRVAEIQELQRRRVADGVTHPAGSEDTVEEVALSRWGGSTPA